MQLAQTRAPAASRRASTSRKVQRVRCSAVVTAPKLVTTKSDEVRVAARMAA
jgi:hypothetical protein